MQLRFSLLLVFLLGQVTAEASLPDNVTAVIGIPYAKPPLRTFRFEVSCPYSDDSSDDRTLNRKKANYPQLASTRHASSSREGN
uniref:COesterase domain-containing protein n=1 Tax=Steinernema glaseri TaxID=37863 RepID=A0A1I7ZFH9_9BILA